MSFRNLDALFDDVTKVLTTPVNHTYYRKPNVRTPEYVQSKNDEGYTLEVPAIGASKNDVSVKVEDMMLKIIVKPTSLSNYSREFDCEWLVPETVDQESVAAKLENGLLTVKLKYKQPSKKVNVDVTVN